MAVYLDRALGQIRIFADEKVAFADGHALHGAILGRMIAASPASALLHARAAKRATTTAFQLGDSARAVEVIEQVLELAPGFPQAQATARALADGADPVVYMQRLQNRAE